MTTGYLLRLARGARRDGSNGLLGTRREGDGALVGAVGDCDPGFLTHSISCVALRELGGGREVRLVGRHSLGGPRSCYVVPGSRSEANGNAWNSSQDGSSEVLREIHLEWWL
jgi:hypothetical protein